MVIDHCKRGICHVGPARVTMTNTPFGCGLYISEPISSMKENGEVKGHSIPFHILFVHSLFHFSKSDIKVLIGIIDISHG